MSATWVVVPILLATLSPVAAPNGSVAPPLTERLTRSSWQSMTPPAAAYPADVKTWDFYANGTYRHRKVSDVTETDEGVWWMEKGPVDSGVVFLLSLHQPRGRLPTEQALSVQVRESELLLGEGLYRPMGTSEPAPKIEGDGGANRARLERGFVLWRTLTHAPWVGVGAVPPGYPDSVVFSRTGRYWARMSSTACVYRGTWSVVAFGDSAGEIRMSVPANRCDPRGPTAAFVRALPVQLTTMGIRLHHSLYTAGTR